MNPSLKYAKFGHLSFPYFYAKNTTKGLHFIGMAQITCLNNVVFEQLLKHLGLTIVIFSIIRIHPIWFLYETVLSANTPTQILQNK